MEIAERKLICILGLSGCGKTTLLNLMAGLIRPDRGELAGFSTRRVSYIFQEPRLINWKTVRGNVEFVLKEEMPAAERMKAIDNYLDLVGLTGYGGYYPRQLSGGMRQRVAIARAFAYPSDLLLMDEPFNSLDLRLKLSLIGAFTGLWLRAGRTTIFVTHDIQEALLLGDEIVILTTGPAQISRILTVDVPRNERSLHTATVSPPDATDQSVYWTSSNSGVTSVVYGVVTAVSPGSATITVTTTDGGFTDSCLVTVQAVQNSYDLNGDNAVNVQDLVLVGQHFTS